MSVDAIVENLTRVLSSGPGLDGSLKMNFGDDGMVRIEGTSVSTDDSEADADQYRSRRCGGDDERGAEPDHGLHAG